MIYMFHDCENCKYSDIDYIFDEETGEEYPLYTCKNGNDTSLDFECNDFEEYKPKPYVEHFKECDGCEYVKQCEADGYILECTTRFDNHRHYVKGIGCYCRKENGMLEDKRLSEVIDMADKLINQGKENMIKLLQKAIDRFGDITYRELMKGKIYELYD